MTRREEQLAMIRAFDMELTHHLVLSWHWWNPAAFFHYREARRLQRKLTKMLDNLPPARYRQASDASLRDAVQVAYARKLSG